ncbi:MAG TPA: PorV/PorQ family protein [Elusimicrobiota bacterium]|nr:PorV/PorQ family protein [Elusimicrobiota bacterium]
MRTAALAGALLVTAAAGARALSLTTGGPGTSGADFLTVGVGARALGMGGAFTAVDSGADANAVNWNPAALALVAQRGVTASYNSLFVDENQGFLGYAAPVKSGGAWAAGVDYLVVSNIPQRAGDTETPDSTFNNGNYAATLSYARKFSDDLSLGSSLKYVRVDLDSLKENAMALDFGALAKTPFDGLTAGASVRNFGTNIGPDPLPLTLAGGLAYKAFDSKLTLSTDADWLATERAAYWSLGGEFWISANLAARAGYQFGHSVDELRGSLVGMSIGLGLKVGRFSMDYAFLPYGDLGDTHRITLGLRFE